MRWYVLLLSMAGSSLVLSACDDGDGAADHEATSGGEPTEATTGAMTRDDASSDAPTPDPSASGPVSGSSDGGVTSGPEGSSDDGGSTGPVTGCGDDVVDEDEVCDGVALMGRTCQSEGFDAGALACAGDCGSLDTSACRSFACGNQVAEGTEQCDGVDLAGVTCRSEGFDSGVLGCSFDCTLDTRDCGSCGNVIVDGDEACDGVALFGESCASMGYDSGQLRCRDDCLGYDAGGCGTCGNALIDGDEECDSGDKGGATCLTAGFDSGTLGCNSDQCTFDTSGCGLCGNNVVDGDEECDDGNTNTQCLPGCEFCPGGVLFEEDFSDNSAGWTLDPEWEIGPSVASPSPGSCGSGDPEFDHTPTDDNGVAGAVLGGDISFDPHPFYYLTSPPIDASTYSFLSLELWRWLNSDYTPFMQNQIEVWDGAAWQVVWQSGDAPGVQDSEWVAVSYDIAPYANAALQVRIGWNVDSEGAFVCSGWNVDDLRIIGVTCPA